MLLSLIFVIVRSLIFSILGGRDNTDSVFMVSYESPMSNGTIIPRGDFSKIDSNNEMIIIVHGFTSNYKDFQSICQLHKQKDPSMTVLNLDWKQQAEGSNFIKASKNVEMIGKFLGKWILDARINPNKVRIMGHSLGAHVAGIAAKMVFAKTGRKFKEIRGADPAGPALGYLVFLPATLRLDATDAQSVLCIHTNRGFFGIGIDVGSTNVYVNNAWSQPGCSDVRFPLCSHFFAVPLYAKAIVDPRYVAYRISGFSALNKPVGFNRQDSIVLGEDLPLNKRGMYYLEVGSLPNLSPM